MTPKCPKCGCAIWYEPHVVGGEKLGYYAECSNNSCGTQTIEVPSCTTPEQALAAFMAAVTPKKEPAMQNLFDLLVNPSKITFESLVQADPSWPENIPFPLSMNTMANAVAYAVASVNAMRPVPNATPAEPAPLQPGLPFGNRDLILKNPGGSTRLNHRGEFIDETGEGGPVVARAHLDHIAEALRAPEIERVHVLTKALRAIGAVGGDEEVQVLYDGPDSLRVQRRHSPDCLAFRISPETVTIEFPYRDSETRVQFQGFGVPLLYSHKGVVASFTKEGAQTTQLGDLGSDVIDYAQLRKLEVAYRANDYNLMLRVLIDMGVIDAGNHTIQVDASTNKLQIFTKPSGYFSVDNKSASLASFPS